MNRQSAFWQDKLKGMHHGFQGSAQAYSYSLQEVCRWYQIDDPIFQLVSDRRGGRTAWSSGVTVYGTITQAHHWYSGHHNAKEDAAEKALQWLNVDIWKLAKASAANRALQRP
jgi:hypothetical protein